MRKQKKEVDILAPAYPVEKDNKTKDIHHKGFFDKLKDKMAPSQTFLVEMNFQNGTCGYFVVKAKHAKFIWKKQTYVIDEERKKFCNTSKLYMLRYNEGFAIPFQTSVTAADMKAELPPEYTDPSSQMYIKTSFDPALLTDVLKAEYAKGVIAGAEISVYIKRMFILTIITIVIVSLHLIANAYKSKWF